MQPNLRLLYSKTGRAAFVSHLDTMKVFARAFYRADLPLRFTEGFNPHAYISIALPLPVGMESLCEALDVGVTDNVNLSDLPERLNLVLPEGFCVTKAAMGGRPFGRIALADYCLTADSGIDPKQAEERFRLPVMVDKRSKKGVTPTDIAPLIHSLKCEPSPEGLRIFVTVNAADPVLNPEYIGEAWRLYLDPDAVFTFVRTALRDSGGALFQ